MSSSVAWSGNFVSKIFRTFSTRSAFLAVSLMWSLTAALAQRQPSRLTLPDKPLLRSHPESHAHTLVRGLVVLDLVSSRQGSMHVRFLRALFCRFCSLEA